MLPTSPLPPEPVDTLPDEDSPAGTTAGATPGHGAPVEAMAHEVGPAPLEAAETGPAATAPPAVSPTEPAAIDPAAADAAASAAAADTSPNDTSPHAAAPGDTSPTAAPTEMTPARCGERLKALFPALFGGAAKPLKLRIQVDIQQRAPGVFTRKSLSAFLHRHTGSHAYLTALARATQRFDLDGRPCAELSAEHRQAAAEELARRRAGADERRALEAQQRHNRAGLLRDFETTTLTRANFCALKVVAEDELDGLLALARQEAAERPAREPVPQRRPAPAARERPQGPGRPPMPHGPRRGPPGG